jgi:hypothetical protein
MSSSSNKRSTDDDDIAKVKSKVRRVMSGDLEMPPVFATFEPSVNDSSKPIELKTSSNNIIWIRAPTKSECRAFMKIVSSRNFNVKQLNNDLGFAKVQLYDSNVIQELKQFLVSTMGMKSMDMKHEDHDVNDYDECISLCKRLKFDRKFDYLIMTGKNIIPISSEELSDIDTNNKRVISIHELDEPIKINQVISNLNSSEYSVKGHLRYNLGQRQEFIHQASFIVDTGAHRTCANLELKNPPRNTLTPILTAGSKVRQFVPTAKCDIYVGDLLQETVMALDLSCNLLGMDYLREKVITMRDDTFRMSDIFE